MIQKGILYTVDATTGKPTNIPIRNVWINFNVGNSIKARAQTDDKGSFSLDVPVGKYTVQLALGSTSPILRAGQLFEVTSSSGADAFIKWLYSETGDINDALLQSFKAISNEVNANANRAEDAANDIDSKILAATSNATSLAEGAANRAEDAANDIDSKILAATSNATSLAEGAANRAEDAKKGAQNILNDMQSNSVGSGKWMKEGAYGLGIETPLNSYSNDLGINTFVHYNVSNIPEIPNYYGGIRFSKPYGNSDYCQFMINEPWEPPILNYRRNGQRYTFRMYSEQNTTVDSNGFLKRASPIIKLFDTGIEYTGFNKEPMFTKLSTGVYQISNTNGLRVGNESGDWYLELPKDRYGNPYFNVETERLNDGVIIRVYEREEHYLPSGRFFESDRDGTQIESFQKVVINGKLIDLKEDWRCISLRFREDQYKLVDKPIVNLYKPM